MFSKGHYSNVHCVHLPAGLGRTSTHFEIGIHACGTSGNTENGLYGYGAESGSGTYFENIIVIQVRDTQTACGLLGIDYLLGSSMILKCKKFGIRRGSCDALGMISTRNRLPSDLSPWKCWTSSGPILQATMLAAGCRSKWEKVSCFEIF